MGENDIALNIGKSAGTRNGQKFNVIGQETTLEVISDQPETSTARIVKGNGPVTEGMRVEAAKRKAQE